MSERADIAIRPSPPRPSKYRPDVAAAILEGLSEGKSLTAICQPDGMPPRQTVEQWVLDDREGFAARYLHARFNGVMRLHDKCLEELDDVSKDMMDDGQGRKVVNSANVSRLREKLQHYRWLMEKFFPDKKVQTLTGQGPNEQPVAFDLSRLTIEELVALEALLTRAALPAT